MTIATAPSLADLRAICEFATAAAFHQPDLAKLHEMQCWLDALENLDDASKIRMAVDTAEAAGPFEGLLAISTAHVSLETAKRLTNGDLPITMYDHGKSGWQVFVPLGGATDWTDIATDYVEKDFPHDLLVVMTYARDRGCCWLLLDEAAAEVSDLSTYEW